MPFLVNQILKLINEIQIFFSFLTITTSFTLSEEKWPSFNIEISNLYPICGFMHMFEPAATNIL